MEIISAVKLAFAYILRGILRIFFIFPVVGNRVIFTAFNGTQYACNPRYISEHLNRKYKKMFEIIWVFSKPEQFAYLKQQGIQVCRRHSLKYYYWKLTARISVTNMGWGTEVPKRKGQYEIQTWHGGGAYKRTGFSRTAYATGRIYQKLRWLDMNRYDLFLSSSTVFSKEVIRESFSYSGEIMDVGMPRNDALVNGEAAHTVQQRVREALKIPADNKVVLCAPTWGACSQAGFGFSYTQLQCALESRFGGEWSILLRMHGKAPVRQEEDISILDVTQYDNMQELLMISDVLITDYSSCIWDFSLMGKACFLFCPDWEAYSNSFGFYRPIQSWGFPVCETSQGLYDAIVQFDIKAYTKAISRHHEELGSTESGAATEQVCERINIVRTEGVNGFLPG